MTPLDAELSCCPSGDAFAAVASRVGLRVVYHQGFLASYYTSTVESPVRIKAIHNRLQRHYPVVTPEAAGEEDILRVHERSLLLNVRDRGKQLYQTALLAAGGAICAARLALGGTPAFAAVRPPGHHAGRNRNGRFCFFNNLAVAVSWAMQDAGIERVVVIDIDMHQGDGTAEIFSDSPRVEMIDLWADERRNYLDQLRSRLDEMRAADLVAVSAGFDWGIHDWGGLLTDEDFFQIGRHIAALAGRLCAGRLFAVLEGGYETRTIAATVHRFCQGLEASTLQGGAGARQGPPANPAGYP